MPIEIDCWLQTMIFCRRSIPWSCKSWVLDQINELARSSIALTQNRLTYPTFDKINWWSEIFCTAPSIGTTWICIVLFLHWRCDRTRYIMLVWVILVDGLCYDFRYHALQRTNEHLLLFEWSTPICVVWWWWWWTDMHNKSLCQGVTIEITQPTAHSPHSIQPSCIRLLCV